MSGLWQNPAIVDKWYQNTKALKTSSSLPCQETLPLDIRDGDHFWRYY